MLTGYSSAITILCLRLHVKGMFPFSGVVGQGQVRSPRLCGAETRVNRMRADRAGDSPGAQVGGGGMCAVPSEGAQCLGDIMVASDRGDNASRG